MQSVKKCKKYAILYIVFINNYIKNQGRKFKREYIKNAYCFMHEREIVF